MNNTERSLCNKLDDNNPVIFGHDYGASVWIRAVEIEISDRIFSDDVKEIGNEVSVDIDFFNRLLKPLFLDVFDAELPANKYRYTYAFSDEGSYVRGFEEGILEHNFFTYEQIRSLLDQIEKNGRDCGRTIAETEYSQLQFFATYVRRIMDENPGHNLISVMS